jgi:transposase
MPSPLLKERAVSLTTLASSVDSSTGMTSFVEADAEAAARTLLSGKDIGEPKSADGCVEMIRSLRVARRSAMKARTQAANQLHALVITCPEPLRSGLHRLPVGALAERAARFRPGPMDSPRAASKLALRHLARRHACLGAEIAELDRELDVLVAKAAPGLIGMMGIGDRRRRRAPGGRRRQP